MAKVLMIDYEKCAGCRTCEMACSIKHEGVRIAARILGVDVMNPDQIKIGTPVTVEYQERVHGGEKKTFLAFRAIIVR